MKNDYPKKTYKQKYCPYRLAWVNQGIASCLKYKNPFTDCNECEYQEEMEVTLNNSNY